MHTESAENAGRAFALVLVDELVRHGMQHAVVAPGSRSTPIALALIEDPRVTVHVRIDERSAAYLALGLAKASGCVVPVLCTSGTAASYFHGAVMEADLSRDPAVGAHCRPPAGAARDRCQPDRRAAGHVRQRCALGSNRCAPESQPDSVADVAITGSRGSRPLPRAARRPTWAGPPQPPVARPAHPHRRRSRVPVRPQRAHRAARSRAAIDDDPAESLTRSPRRQSRCGCRRRVERRSRPAGRARLRSAGRLADHRRAAQQRALRRERVADHRRTSARRGVRCCSATGSGGGDRPGRALARPARLAGCVPHVVVSPDGGNWDVTGKAEAVVCAARRL